MYVNTQVQQMIVMLNRFALKLSLKQCADPVEAFIDGFGVGYT